VISITVAGQQEIIDHLDALEVALDVESILDEAAALMLARMRQRYLAKLTPDGIPWIPSARGLYREALGGPGTLFDTGRLFHSIQLFGSDEPNTRTLGTDVEYGPYLQGAADKNWIFLGFGEEDAELAQELVVQRIQESLT
jgi:hypothetical protein